MYAKIALHSERYNTSWWKDEAKIGNAMKFKPIPNANEAFSKSALLLEMSIHDHAQQPKVQGSKFSTEE